MAEKVIVELCLSNSIGSRYLEPTVQQWQEVARQEADELLRKPMSNGFFWRLQPPDRTGNE